jgi:hypothetical protein
VGASSLVKQKRPLVKERDVGVKCPTSIDNLARKRDRLRGKVIKAVVINVTLGRQIAVLQSEDSLLSGAITGFKSFIQISKYPMQLNFQLAVVS